MYITTITISPKGQIVLPKKIRNILNTSIISLEINDDNQIIISPIHDVGASLSSYQKNTALSFEQIRQESWNSSISVLKDKEV
jgi:AbrB family looped-hinge helix DNA binding protein